MRFLHIFKAPTPAPAPASLVSERLQQGIELHSAFANGCIFCRQPIRVEETCIVYRGPLRVAHIDCFCIATKRSS